MMWSNTSNLARRLSRRKFGKQTNCSSSIQLESVDVRRLPRVREQRALTAQRARAMASLLGGGLLQAREGAYFKSEQEGDLHQYLIKRVKEGKIKLSPDELKVIQGTSRTGLPETSDSSESVYEVGMEILQQKARYESLDAKARARMLTRVKASMPDASAEDIRRISANMAMYGAAGAVYGAHRTQRLALGGSRRALAQLSREAASQQQTVKELSPEATEAMRRQFFAGLRALTYGSILGILGVTGVATLIAMNVGDVNQLKVSIQSSFEPVKTMFKAYARDVKPGSAHQGGGGVKDSLFAKKLRERFENFKM